MEESVSYILIEYNLSIECARAGTAERRGGRSCEQTDGHAGQYYITTAYQSPARWDLGLRGRISN